MADDYLLENGLDRYLLEDGSGAYLLEEQLADLWRQHLMAPVMPT